VTKFRLGDGYDKSRTRVQLTTTGESNLYVRGGDLHQEASAEVTIDDRGYSVDRPDARRAGPVPSPSAFWQGISRAAMILFGLVVTLTALAVASSKVTAWALPLVIAAALLGTYLLALVVMPANERGHLKGFGGVLSTFIKAALRPGTPKK
jgi:hypothetical protein